MKRATGYIRVSTGDQALGLSLDAQRRRIGDYCRVYDLELVDVKEDQGISGRRADRPGWLAAMQSIRSGESDLIVVVSLDRVARSVRLFAEVLAELGARGGLVSILQQFDSTTASGELYANIHAAFAQFESQLIAERTSRTMQEARRRGHSTGRAPYGWQRGPAAELVPHPTEQRILKRILRWRRARQGPLSYRKCAERLNKARDYNRHGRPWNHRLVRVVFVNHEQRRSEGLPTVARRRIIQ